VLVSSSGRANAIVLVFTVLSLLIAGELALRVAYHPEIVRSIIRYDALLGWSLEPGAHMVTDVTERGLRTHLDVNALGLRERDIARRDAHRRRVLIMGDSVVFGSGLEANERFSDLIGAELGDSFEVVNAGVPGWGNDQELLLYETSLRPLDADVVVLTFTGSNDVVNNALAGALLEGGTKPRFDLSGDSLVLTPPAPRPGPDRVTRFKHLLRKSRLLVFVNRRLQRRAYRHRTHEDAVHEYHGFEAYRHLSHWSAYDTRGGEAIASAWKVTEAIIARFEEDCRADSAAFLVFAFPSKLEVDDAWREKLVRETAVDGSHIDRGLPYRRLAAFCASRDMAFFYPIDEFRAAARTAPLYFEGDSHPNPRANALAAGLLSPLIQQSTRRY
jgi:hypothetical protein